MGEKRREENEKDKRAVEIFLRERGREWGEGEKGISTSVCNKCVIV